MLNPQMNRHDYQSAMAWLESRRNLAVEVRDSFHFLVADFWLAGIEQGRFKEVSQEAGSAQMLILWDEEVPKPNPNTALAWTILCGNLYQIFGSGSTGMAALPESIDPYLWAAQSQSMMGRFAADWALPTQTHMGMYMGIKFRQKLKETGYDDSQIIGKWNSKSEVHLHNATLDRRRREDGRVRSLHRFQAAAMSQILTPLTSVYEASYSDDYRGVALRGLTQHGLWVKPPASGPLLWTQTGQEVQINSHCPPLKHVPLGTPPVWFNFRVKHDQGREAAMRWMEALFTHMPAAADRIRQWVNKPEALVLTEPQPDPSWESRLIEAGAIHKPTTSKRNQRAATNAAIDATLQAMFNKPFV